LNVPCLSQLLSLSLLLSLISQSLSHFSLFWWNMLMLLVLADKGYYLVFLVDMGF
jgi:hypothetical protein